MTPTFYIRRCGWFRWQVVTKDRDYLTERVVTEPYFGFVAACHVRNVLQMQVNDAYTLGMRNAFAEINIRRKETARG